MSDIIQIVESFGISNAVLLIVLGIVWVNQRGMLAKMQTGQNQSHADIIGVRTAGLAVQTMGSSSELFQLQLKSLLEAQRESDVERGKMAGRIEYMNAEIGRYQREIASHMATIESQQKQIEQLTKQLGELVERVSALEAALSDREQKIAALQAQITALEAENAALKGQAHATD